MTKNLNFDKITLIDSILMYQQDQGLLREGRRYQEDQGLLEEARRCLEQAKTVCHSSFVNW